VASPLPSPWNGEGDEGEAAWLMAKPLLYLDHHTPFNEMVQAAESEALVPSDFPRTRLWK
jgi:hypothetical protein